MATERSPHRLWALLASVIVFNPQPNSTRKLQPFDASPFLQRDGSNIAAALDRMAKTDPERLQNVIDYLRIVVPDIEHCHAIRYGSYQTVSFDVRQDVSTVNSFDASMMSDGTLRALAILVAAHQKSSLSGERGLVCIEEPETALHPAAAGVLMGALNAASWRSQVIVSTHSPDLLDCIDKDHPATVLHVEQREGATLIAPLAPEMLDLVTQQVQTFGELQRRDYLFPDENAIDRQREQQIATSGAMP